MLQETGDDYYHYLARHRSGDWGDLDTYDHKENELALRHGWRIVNPYPVGEKCIWIIAEADRTYTAILLPEEY